MGMSDNIGNTRKHTMQIMRGAAVQVKHYARHLVHKLQGSTIPRNIMRDIMRGAPVQVKYYARVFAPRISGKQMNSQRRETNEQETNEPGVYILYIYISICWSLVLRITRIRGGKKRHENEQCRKKHIFCMK